MRDCKESYYIYCCLVNLIKICAGQRSRSVRDSIHGQASSERGSDASARTGAELHFGRPRGQTAWARGRTSTPSQVRYTPCLNHTPLNLYYQSYLSFIYLYLPYFQSIDRFILYWTISFHFISFSSLLLTLILLYFVNFTYY